MSNVPWYKKELYIDHVNIVEIVAMAENLSVMLEAGLTVSEALDVLVQQTDGKLKQILIHVNEQVHGGEMLGDALATQEKIFGALFINAVRVGEGSGTLVKNLTHLAEQMEHDLEVRRNVQGAMLYPGIIIFSTFVLGLALATFVLPQMASIFRSLDVQLPWTTRTLIWTAEIFQNYGAIVTPSIFLGLVLMVYLLRRRFLRPFVHQVILHLPLFGLFVHEVNRARFCRSLGTMLQSGVPIQEAIGIAATAMPNWVYKHSLEDLHNLVESGESFAKIISRYPRLYPKMIEQMIAVGERSGGLSESLLYLARFYEQKVSIKAKSISTIIEPVLLIVIGVVVGFVALSIFTPIYSVTEGLSF